MSDGTFSKVIAGIKALVEAQVHAMIVLGFGVLLSLMGHKDEGLLVLGGAIGMLRGHQGGGAS